MVLLPDDDTCYTPGDLKALNLLRHPVWVFDIERKCMYWANHAALVIWCAASLEELLKRDFASDLTEATAKRMEDHLSQLSEGGETNEQWTYYPNGGLGKTLSVAASGIRIAGGRVAALAEAELPTKDDFQQDSILAAETFRHIPLPCSRFEVDGTLQYQNPEAIQVFGSTTLADRNVDNFVSRFLDRELGKTVLKKVQDGEENKVAEAELYTPQGPRFFAVRARKTRNPVAKDSDSGYMIVDTARDITEIRQAQKDTKRARIKNDFLAQIAHEIRTPLHQIVGHMDLLELTELTQQQLVTVHTVQSSVDQLMTIISDMLDFSKLESGMMTLEHVPFVLQDIVDCSVSSIRQELEEKNLQFEINVNNNLKSTEEVPLPSILIGDPNRLRQILQNLLDNGVKFTEKGSVSLSVTARQLPIPIKTQAAGTEKAEDTQETVGKRQSQQSESTKLVRFEVKDTGIGMDKSQKASVFEKYQQAHAGIRTNFGGVGLGLAICRSEVELMNGQIGVESELNKGTLFWFEVPLSVPPPPPVADNLPPAKKRPSAEEATPSCIPEATTTQPSASTSANPFAEELRSLRVLVAEDNKINQKMVRSMLQRIGHQVTVAENGQVCVDELAKSQPEGEQRFDLVLMDIQMPVMDGIEATRKIRGELGYDKAKLPVVGLTASYRHEDLDYYVGIGMNHCIGKPVKLNILKRTIESQAAAAAGKGVLLLDE